MRQLLFILLTGLLCVPMFGQNKRDFNSKFLEANQLMEEKLWSRAVDEWRGIIDIAPDNANVNYKLGYCYLQTANDKMEALPYLKVASGSKISKSYDPFDPTEEKVPVDALFYLGKSYHLNYQMDEAIEMFNIVLTKVGKKHRFYKESLREIEMCEEAKRQVASPKNHIVTNVGSAINGEANDFTPVVTLDDLTMYFTSRRLKSDSSNFTFRDIDTGEFNEDIYVSYKDQEGNWSAPEALNIDRNEHCAVISSANNGQRLYVYIDNEGNGQVYETRLENDEWSEPELLGSDINSDAWETHVSESVDGNTLFFVSNREDGLGGRDIYRCVKLPTGEWSKALNLGDVINTEYEEDAPFISADGKTLYFSSTGHNSMGGFDIMYSTISDDGEWTAPVNIGYPVNTVDDDVFFMPTADPRVAYYSSRKEEGFGYKDIYRIDMPDAPFTSNLAVLKGYIFPPEGSTLPSDAHLIVTNLKTGETNIYRPRQRDGAYIAILPPCNDYHLEYFANDEKVHEEFMEVPCESAYTEIEKEIFLLPVYLKESEVDVDPDQTPDGGDDTSGGDDDSVVIVPDGGDDDSSSGSDDDVIDVVPDVPESTKGDGVTAYYEKFFIYDMGMKSTDNIFDDFIGKVSEIIDNKGKAVITVESSASNVPSSRFDSNEDLSSYRNEKARENIINGLKAKGYNESQFSFEAPVERVQGPSYGNDAWNKAKYEPYQYIKVWVE